MALFDITLLQSTLAPVAAAVTVQLYAGAPAAMNPAQIQAFVGAATPAATATTDANGHFTANLTPATQYLVVPTGYNGAYINAPAASGTGIYQTVFPITGLCKVTGSMLAADGTPQANVVVTANLNASGALDGTHVILASAPTTTTDTNGNWSLSLVPNDLITPKNTLYNFVFTLPATVVPAYPFFSFGVPVKPHGPSIARSVEVPNVPTVDFSTLVG